MINKSNIEAYIQYLFQHKNGQKAPGEILDSWLQIEEADLSKHLQGLYRHWNLSETAASELEQSFIKTSQKTPLYDIPQPEASSYQSNPTDAQPLQSKPKSYKNLAIVVSILLLAVLAGGAYYIMNNHSNADVDNTTHVPDIDMQDNAVEAPATAQPAEIPEAEPATAVEVEQNGNDNLNIATLRILLKAESNQNWETILTTFSPTIEQYWAVNYPTPEEIEALYRTAWEKRNDIKQDNIVIDKVADNTYNVKSTFSYYDIEKQKTFSKQINTRYEFDDNHKIVKTYGL